MSASTFRLPEAASPLSANHDRFAPNPAVQPMVAAPLKRTLRRRARLAAVGGRQSLLLIVRSCWRRPSNVTPYTMESIRTVATSRDCMQCASAENLGDYQSV